ncbi:MAG: hypothetical protein WC080_00750 [Patescibacteria group bacterium]|jgi:hypothetical protein
MACDGTLIAKDGVIVDKKGQRVVVKRESAGTILVALTMSGIKRARMVAVNGGLCSFAYEEAESNVIS